ANAANAAAASRTKGKKRASTRAGLNTGSNVSNVVLSYQKPETVGFIPKSKLMIMVINSSCKQFVENFSHYHTDYDGIIINCCNNQQTTQLFCSMDWGRCQITVH
ncbi:hypothetical protein, partial [Yersinia mollaretii]|uniref:hypothetical protein n=3 Tax=Yersinia mollaretii TaxID=33060 RepID=UPI001E5FDC8C